MGPPRIAVVSAVASVISVIPVVALVIAQVTNDLKVIYGLNKPR